MRKREVIEPRDMRRIEADALIMAAGNTSQSQWARLIRFYRGLRAWRALHCCIKCTRESLYVPGKSRVERNNV